MHPRPTPESIGGAALFGALQVLKDCGGKVSMFLASLPNTGMMAVKVRRTPWHPGCPPTCPCPIAAIHRMAKMVSQPHDLHHQLATCKQIINLSFHNRLWVPLFRNPFFTNLILNSVNINGNEVC